jgi:hypothetical protein
LAGPVSAVERYNCEVRNVLFTTYNYLDFAAQYRDPANLYKGEDENENHDP